MKLKDIKNILETTGYPVAYRAFSKTTTPQLPFIVYLETMSDNFVADSKVYQKIQRVQIELYSKTKSELAELTLENALDNNDFVYDKLETFMEDEKVYLVTYEITYIK